ncbi:CHAT domain-containing protein [Argonema antarcticum]|uniref:CHAT domain-containing protein n=1 Tax=Argonema antarcticum TaxID=2942763 RepID=UPI002010C8E4|nr:CHAT domain-containing protein [Argonema antarcticum]MCL1472882.1 CHAT domain-containing protein [Argonema antarcticum A004/B2]
MKLGIFLQKTIQRILLVLVTALLCIVAEPIFAKVPYINQLNHREKISRNSIEEARDLQADGFYRRACTSLLQALERSDIECKNLIRDGMSERVKEIFPILPATPHRAIGLRNLGDILRMVGALKTSEKVLEQSLEISNSLSLNQEIGASHFSLGNTKRALGKRAQNFQETEKIGNYYKEALEHYDLAIATSSSDSIDLRAKLNKFSLAIENYPVSNLDDLWLEIKEQVEKLPANLETVYARIYLAESLTCLKLQKMGKEERSRLLFPLPPIVNLCVNEAETKTLANKSPEWEYIGQLLAMAAQQGERLKDVRSQSYALGNLGELYEITQQLPYAIELTEKGLVIGRTQGLNDITYRLKWQLGRLNIKTQKDVKFAIADYNAAIEYLKLVRQDLSAINTDIEFSFRKSVEPLYRQLVELLLPSSGTQPIQENLNKARQLVANLQVAELESFLGCTLQNPTSVELDKVAQDNNAAIIYPIILPKRLAVIVKLPGKELLYYEQNVNETKVEATIDELRREIQKPYPAMQEYLPLAKDLYNWLIKPAEKELRIALDSNKPKTLVFVQDGRLRQIPMAVLYDRESNQYLIEKYAVALNLGLELKSSQNITSQERLEVLSAGITKKLPGLDKLEYVGFELNAIKNLVSTREMRDEKFKRDDFKNLLNSRPFSVVHLATHGKFSSQPEETFIRAYDTAINVRELSDIFIAQSRNRTEPIELLVLSACQTATEDERSALGLAGVAVRSGARSTIASLWFLNDRSSAYLMERFYNYLKDPKVPNKAEALRLAQMELLTNPDYGSEAPAHWAAYILVGNWL